MTWERSCILASAIGSMERLLDVSIRYAKERKQFGQQIGKFQLVATKIVDMKLRLETARRSPAERKQQREHFVTSVLGSPKLFVKGTEHELATMGR